MIRTWCIEKKHCRELLKELQKKKKEKKKERKVTGDEKRHDQNYEMKKIEKKSLRYNNKRNITKDCMAYLA